ncbi:MAG: DUF1684 domain-containing protein [Mycobacteriales bacterium]
MSLPLLQWRRSVAAAYTLARAAAESGHPSQGWLHWRAARDDLFRAHPASPLSPAARAGFAGLPFAAYDPSLRFTLPVLPTDPAHLDVPTGTDGVVPFDRLGRVELPGLGSLDVWWLGSYGGGVFVPIRDGSAGQSTYGGGRYLLDTIKGADLGGDDGMLVIDLNFAYHPSCAYDEAWACPLAPPGNVISAKITAGELLPPGGWT